MQSAHIRVAKELGAESLVERCYAENGTAYKKAVRDLLVFTKAFTVTVIDDGKRQNVPDLDFDQAVRQTMVAGLVITVVGVTTDIGIGGASTGPPGQRPTRPLGAARPLTARAAHAASD